MGFGLSRRFRQLPIRRLPNSGSYTRFDYISIGSLCIHPGRKALKGWETIRQSWLQIFKATRYLEIDLDIMSVEVSGDLAYVVLVEKVMQVAGDRRLEASSMATNTFERMGGQWYLVHHHGSPIMG
ncbi:MAG: nuclear transport factor 2 family protein [Cyanobacteria bacterium J06627_3]